MKRKRSGVVPLSLSWLAGQLGGEVRLEVAAGDPDAPACDIVMYDPVTPPPGQAGDVALAIGIPADSPQALDVTHWAARSGASAVVFKVREQCPPPLRAAAEDAGIAVLTIPPEMVWDQLYVLCRRILATGPDMPDSNNLPPLGDIFALANAIAAMVGGEVVIDNPRVQVVAYSNLGEPIDDLRRSSILARSVPDDMLRRLVEEGVFRRMTQTREAVRLPSWVGTRKRLGVAILAGREILGYIFVVEGDKPFGREAEEMLVQASKIAALHLLHLTSSDDLERRMKSELFRGALEERGSTELLAARLGIEPAGSYTVLALRPAPSLVSADARTDTQFWQRRLRAMAALQCESVWRQSVSTSIGDSFYVLLPGEDVLSTSALVRLGEELAGRAGHAIGVAAHAGLGSTVRHLSQLAVSRREADQVLRLLGGPVTGRLVATWEELRAHAFLLELQQLPSLRRHLECSKVAALVEHDRAHNTPYLQSLEAYLTAQGDVATAAKSVHIHPNTLRYRLRRLSELVGLNLEDPVERIVADLQIRLLQLAPLTATTTASAGTTVRRRPKSQRSANTP